MASLKDRITTRVADLRERRPAVDHVVRMLQHYGEVKGSNQAGAVTFFGFVSFFPILALAFAVIGFAAAVYPDAQRDLVKAIEGILPGIVTDNPLDENALQISDIEDAAPGILSVGLPVLLWSGLGWLSAMRQALLVVFEKPSDEQPSFVFGKLRDLVTLALVGLVLVVSVSVAGVARGFSETILDFARVPGAAVLLAVVTVVVGLGANMVLFYALFRLLAAPEAPHRSLWSGALLGALGFEALKQLSTYLLASTKEQPAFQAFGIALILVVWINYFSRVVMYAAAWAHTAPEARAERESAEAEEEARELVQLDREVQKAAREREREQGLSTSAAAALGGAAMLGAVAAARRTVRHRETGS